MVCGEENLVRHSDQFGLSSTLGSDSNRTINGKGSSGADRSGFLWKTEIWGGGGS